MVADKGKSKAKYRWSFSTWIFIIIVAIILDAIDFIFGYGLVLGTGMDIAYTALAYVIAGPLGLLNIWEIFAVGPLDWIPTFTGVILLMYPLGYVQPPKRAKKGILKKFKLKKKKLS